MTEQGYGCAGCAGANPVNWLLTRLSPAATISSCDEDLPIALVNLLASWLEVDSERLYKAVERFAKAEQAKDAKAAQQQAEADYQAALALIADPSIYEDGNTEYGLEQALALAHELVTEHEAAQ